MFYTIYKITNKINNKIYIGKHQTKDLDDGYMGSGKLIRSAIEKYGIENFKKEIIFIFDNEDDMNSKEAELVTEDFVKEDTNYNLCPGGKGGWGYLNSEYWTYEKCARRGRLGLNSQIKSGLHDKRSAKARKALKEKISKVGSIWWETNNFYGKTHTEETKIKIGSANSEHQKGSGNSQFGTMWITNGKENKKIRKEAGIIPEGWYKGRVSKKNKIRGGESQ